jgi:hypothetical protein
MKTQRLFALHHLLMIPLLGLALLACKRDLEKPQWDTNLLAPFAYTELSIQNIVKSGSFQTNPDNSMDLFIRDTLYTLRMDSLVQVAAPSFDINKTLDQIVFETDPIVTKVTLGMIARQLAAQGNPLGTTILASQGQLVFVPTGVLQNITAGPIAINVNNVLETADVKNGFLDISVRNGLPISITNTEFRISNTNPPAAVIAQPVLTNIAPGTTAVHTEDISGKRVDGNMSANILDMDLGGGLVTIDTNNAITITLQVRDVTVNSATAVFPEQNVLDDESVNYLVDMGSVRLKEMKMASGYVRIQVSSTVPDTIFFTYEIPGAVKDGIPFLTQTKVPPSGGVSVFTYDMTDYVMSLRGKPGDDEYNALYNTLVGRIKYTGNKVALSLTDFMNVKITLEDPVPSYVQGYLGDTIIDLNSSAPLTVFKNVTGGTIQFEDADPAIVIDNGFGVSGSAKINAVVAHRAASAVSLSSPLLGNAQVLARAIDGNPPTTTSTKLSLGGAGSNATALVNLLPTSIDYVGELAVNPSAVIDYTQFAYAAHPVNALMEFRLPLSVIASQLQLSDTIPLSSTPQVNAALKKGKLNLITDNGFPLDANVKAYFLDQNGNVMDSLSTDQVVKRAPKGSDGKVIREERTVIYYTLSAEKIASIQQASQVNFKVTFTSDAGVYTKIYSDYKIKFKLTGDIQYTVNGQQ